MGRNVAIGLVFLAGMGAGAAAWGQTEPGKKLPFEVSKETTVVVGLLREDGTVDYAGALNERYRAAAGENGFADWLGVMGTGNVVYYGEANADFLAMCGVEDTPANVEVWVTYPHFLKALNGADANTDQDVELAEKMQGRIWKAEEDPMLAKYLEKEGRMLALAEEASKKPKWWVPTYSSGVLLIAAGLPGLASTRDVANRLCARAMLRAGAGDEAGFAEDIGTVRRLARQVGNGRTMIERLVGLAMDSLANKTVAGAASRGVFSAEQCVGIRKFCDGFGEMPTMVGAIHEFERWSVLDFAEHLAVGQASVFTNAATPSTMLPFRTIEWARVDWNLVLKRINEVFDELESGMGKADWREGHDAVKAFDKKLATWGQEQHEKYGGMLWQVKDETREAYSERVAEAILVFMSPSLGRAEELRRREMMEREMVDVVLQAAEEKGRTGKWPAEMEGLPVDMYSKDGKGAVKYVVRAEGVEVYSVGENGEDEGGVRRVGKRRPDDLGVGVVVEVEEGK